MKLLFRTFLHQHKGYKYAYNQKANTKFWIDKITSKNKREKVKAKKPITFG